MMKKYLRLCIAVAIVVMTGSPLCSAQAFDSLRVRHDILSRLNLPDNDTSRIVATIVFGSSCEKCYLYSIPMYKQQKKESSALLVCLYICRRDRELRDYVSRNYLYDKYVPLRMDVINEWKLPRLTQHVILSGSSVTTLPYDPKMLGN
jgi:hypothetical protein